MATYLASKVELRARARSSRFWRRAGAAAIVGYISGAFVYAVAFEFLSDLAFLFEGPREEVWQRAFVAYFPTLFPVIFLMMLFLMGRPSSIIMPIVILAALGLDTDRRGTMVVGACAGLVIGWPTALAFYQEAAVAWRAPFCCVAAGIGFALALWGLCLRHYAPGKPDGS